MSIKDAMPTEHEYAKQAIGKDGVLETGHSMWPLKINYIHMK